MLDILNKTEAEAIAEITKAGLTYRVVKRDGLKQDVFSVAKSRYNFDRVNLIIVAGVVVEAHVG